MREQTSYGRPPVVFWTKSTIFVLALIAGILLKSEGLIIISSALFFLLFLEKTTRLKIPSGIAVLFVLFVVFSLVLGSYYDFYERFAWWDDVLHAFYGAAFAVVGFIIIQYISYQYRITNQIFIICLFSFCFSVTGGVIWEMYEFIYDLMTGGNMQRTHVGRGVDDTMYDLILESSAALVVNIFIYYYLKSGIRNWVGRIYENFLHLNYPHKNNTRNNN